VSSELASPVPIRTKVGCRGLQRLRRRCCFRLNGVPPRRLVWSLLSKYGRRGKLMIAFEVCGTIHVKNVLLEGRIKANGPRHSY
jgi:hypothetical protein